MGSCLIGKWPIQFMLSLGDEYATQAQLDVSPKWMVEFYDIKGSCRLK